MFEVLVFAGTVEGRKAAEKLRARNVPTCAFTATEYGESLLEEGGSLEVRAGRMSEEEMERFMRESGCRLVIDATHPYATEVTANIRAAAGKAGVEYRRVLRATTETEGVRVRCVTDADAAAAYLNGTDGNVLLTTGSKDLAAFTAVKDFENRVFARVLSLPEVVTACAELGFRGKNLIAMQGPFTEEMNLALLRQVEARYLVTKDTGREGGFEEKVAAAKEHGCELVVIGRPTEEEGMSLEECLKDLVNDREIALVGIGTGGDAGSGLTREAEDFCRGADLFIGAKRCLEAWDTAGRETFEEYRPEAIRDCIEERGEGKRIAVLLSGDVGFFSGAKKLLALLPEARLIPGISSVVYLAARVGTEWEDARLVSAHGREAHLVSEIRRNKKVFALLAKKEDFAELCQALRDCGLGKVRLVCGSELGYPTEHILEGTADFLAESPEAEQVSALAVVFAENPAPEEQIGPGVDDEAFLRAKVPMTKEEVRAVSIAKLRLTAGFVLWDVGAGTGSVSVEAARLDPTATVFSIEKKGEAIELLYQNRTAFSLDNIEIIEGEAPAALVELPAPSHVFVGGSSGNLREILQLALEKNPAARIVINAITLETLTESMAATKELGLEMVDVVSVTAAKSRDVGDYHMMTGQNPVYVISGNGRKGEA